MALSSPASFPLLFCSSPLPHHTLWYRALYLSAFYTPEWSRCEEDDTMTSCNPVLYFSYEGELLGLQPKVILQFCDDMGKIFSSHFIRAAGRTNLDSTESSVSITQALASYIGLQPNVWVSQHRESLVWLLCIDVKWSEWLQLSRSWTQAWKQQLFLQDTHYHILLGIEERISPVLLHSASTKKNSY